MTELHRRNMGRPRKRSPEDAGSGVFFVSGPRLSDEQLRFFASPRTWREIVLQPGKRYGDPNWWREAVLEADEMGRGYLEWEKKTGLWTLSAHGREAILGEEGKKR